MKILQILLSSLIFFGCTYAQSTIVVKKLDIVGESLPSIRHITEMKMSGDTLLFVYENENGYGQRFLRRAIIDRGNNTLSIGLDMGKRDDGYYNSYMPYPFLDYSGNINVISQDDSELFAIQNDTTLIRQKRYLIRSKYDLPFPMSQYVQDVFMIAPEKYVFIGREPNGGRQYAMKTDLNLAKIDTIRQIRISPEFKTWMPNAGELAFSTKHQRFAFGYRFHPVIEIFGVDGTEHKTVEIADRTFKVSTLKEADFEEKNIIHAADVSYSQNFIYILHWGSKYSDLRYASPTIYKIDWNGDIVSRYIIKSTSLYKIAPVNDSDLIGWTGSGFIFLSLSQ